MTGNILIIEDEKRLLTNLQLLLADEGYHITTAENGKTGMHYLMQMPFDLVITDIVMEEMNGFEIMESIAAHGFDTLVIVITGYTSTDSAIEALRKGAYDYISKPFDIDMMKISIRRALEKARLQRELKAHMQALEQRVADRTKALAESNHRLHQSIEELKAAQERLIQSEKLSALGELISGIAHELNNPLTGVLGYAELVNRRQDCSPDVRSMLEKIRRDALRCGQIVKKLLSFARKQTLEKRYVDINAICLQTLELLAYQLRVNNVTTIKQLDTTLPKTMADEVQLQQVLLNMFTNACQAMEESYGENQLLVMTTHDSQKIYITISDTGSGIASENLSRIFDPFYTTKEKGTGLGLSLSYGIIKEHGGETTVSSAFGQGTTFTIELPIIVEIPLAQETHTHQSSSAAPAPKRVLIIDDEQSILDLFVSLLHSLGHQPEVTLSGKEALQKIATQDYDLIICDLRMPEIDGRRIYQFLKEKHPHLVPRLIFSSGDTLNEAISKFIEESECLFLRKPFLLKEFQQVFSQALLRAEQSPDV